MIDLYAVTDDPAPPLPDVAGLSAVASHGLALVCGPAAGDELTPDVLWRHEEVVEALMEDRDLLPVRFGTRVHDETAAARALGERHRELAEALEKVRGAVELSLRVRGERRRDDSESDETVTSGAAYLRARARAVEAQEDVRRTVHRPLAAIARASRQLPAREPTELLRAAYLVDRGAVSVFTDDVARLQQAHPELRLLCTGPWPPYSFSES